MTSSELTQAREALGLTRSELARLLETTDRSVRAWENDADTQWREIPFAVAALLRLAVKYPQVRHDLGIFARDEPKGGL
jgi:DNA-binding transcriptional regulator YiaG